MKRFFVFLLIFAGLKVYSQFGRYVSGTETVGERLKQENDMTDEFLNFRDADFKTLMNLFISYNLSGMEIPGEGKSSTLLTLDISEEGTLIKVSVTGPNDALNDAVQKLFVYRTGKKMSKLPVRSPRQIQCPITIEH